MAHPTDAARPARGKTSAASTGGSFRATVRDEATVVLAPVEPETPPVEPDSPLRREPVEPQPYAQPATNRTTSGPGFAARRARSLHRLALALWSDSRGEAGSLLNQALSAADSAIPGQPVRSRLGLAQQRFGDARRSYDQIRAQAATYPETPEQRQALARARTAVQEAGYDLADAELLAAAVEAQDEPGSANEPDAPPTADVPPLPHLSTSALPGHDDARRAVAEALATRRRTPMPAGALRDGDSVYIADDQGMPVLGTVDGEPQVRATEPGGQTRVFAFFGLPNGSTTRRSFAVGDPLMARLLAAPGAGD